jgi:hypothetical protein
MELLALVMIFAISGMVIGWASGFLYGLFANTEINLSEAGEVGGALGVTAYLVYMLFELVRRTLL